MAAASPIEQLNVLIASMITTGLVEEQFMAMRNMQDPESIKFFARLVRTFLDTADHTLGELAQMLERPFVDFHAVHVLLIRLKGSSASMGARQVRLACIQLEEFIDQQKGRDEWVSTIAKARAAFYEVGSKLQTVVQLDRQIFGF